MLRIEGRNLGFRVDIELDTEGILSGSPATQLGDFIPRSPEGEFNNEVIGSSREE